MIILPAIDIQNGECVRLTKGDFTTAERVAEDPLQTAVSFKEAGAEWIHMVDLDGAKTAQIQNRDVFISVAKETELKVELGGGIRDLKTAEYYLENGIERIILGSLAVRNPKLVAELVREYGDRIIVGIDAENGQVKIDGWMNEGRVNFITLAREMEYIGVRHIIYTDITKDGTLSGPNLDDFSKLRENISINVIASGGITGIKDITALSKLGLYGAICGKAIYHGTLDLKEAIVEAAKIVHVKKFKSRVLKNIKSEDDFNSYQGKIVEDGSKDQRVKNQRPKDQHPKDQRVKNQHVKNQRPKDQSPKDQRPKDQRPKDQRPKDQHPKNQRPKDQHPKNQHPKDQRPKDQRPKNQRPKDQHPKDQRVKNQHPKDQRSKDQRSKDQRSKDQRPKNQHPKNQHPKDQRPKDQHSND